MKVYRVKKSEKFPNGEATVYTVEEAEENGIRYVANHIWRTAQYGEYVETDDGFVVPVIKRNDHPTSGHIKTPTGCFHTNRSGTIFDTAPFYNRNTFSRQSRWNGDSPKLTFQQERFFQHLFKYWNVDAAISYAYPTLSRRNRDNIRVEILASKIFKRKMAELSNVLREAGITEEYLAEKLKTWLDEGRVGDRATLVRLAAMGLGTNMFGEQKLIPPNREKEQPLFANTEIEDAQVEDIKPLKLGAVRDRKTA